MQDFNSQLQTTVNLKISIAPQVRVLRKSCFEVSNSSLLSFANILFRISLDMVFLGEKNPYKGKTQEELLTPVNERFGRIEIDCDRHFYFPISYCISNMFW